jgi:hypothetical protein
MAYAMLLFIPLSLALRHIFDHRLDIAASRHLETAATLTGGAAIQRLLCSGGTGTQRVTVTEFAVLNGCGRHRLANSSPYPILID